MKLVELLLPLALLASITASAQGTDRGQALGPTESVSRPAYNTGIGFFVKTDKLYDPNGHEFRIRGVNRLHWDSSSEDGIVKSGANTTRWNIDFTRDPADNVNLVKSNSIAHKIVPIVGNWTTTCKSETAALTAAVATWVAQAPQWTALNKYLIVNVANEWGPSDPAIWRDAYIHAVASLRKAGYTGPLLIDAGGCGQDTAGLLTQAGAVLDSDPQKNILFSYHVYGGDPPWTENALKEFFARLSKVGSAQGLLYLIGEFGPGKDIGRSPTQVTPGQVIVAAEANGLGWLAWAWDDNDLMEGKSDDNSFSLTYNGPGIYGRKADLTQYGRDVVLNPSYGLKVLARPASIFQRGEAKK